MHRQSGKLTRRGGKDGERPADLDSHAGSLRLFQFAFESCHLLLLVRLCLRAPSQNRRGRPLPLDDGGGSSSSAAAALHPWRRRHLSLTSDDGGDGDSLSSTEAEAPETRRTLLLTGKSRTNSTCKLVDMHDRLPSTSGAGMRIVNAQKLTACKAHMGFAGTPRDLGLPENGERAPRATRAAVMSDSLVVLFVNQERGLIENSPNQAQA